MFRGPQFSYLFRLLLDAIILLLFCYVAFRTDQCCFNASIHSFPFPIFLISLLLWYFSARVFHFYTSITLFSFSQEMTIFLRLLSLHLLMLVFILFLFFEDIGPYRNWIWLYHAGLFISFPLVKYFYRVITSYIRSQFRYVRRILVVGSPDFSANMYRSGKLINNLEYSIVGFVGDFNQQSMGANLLGPINELESILTITNADEVFLALPSHNKEEITFVVDCCERHNIQVNVVNDFNRLGTSTKSLTNYAGFPIVSLRYFPLDDIENRFFKRFFDILFSSLVLILFLSWLTPLIALLIKLNSRGSVFFKQERWGLNNKKIYCYKFRTMFVQDEQDNGTEAFSPARKNDPRVTSLGRILRKTSIDELPQFINVLLGDMSVVGPRPHPIPLSLESKDVVQHYMLRHLVKPGITGWAQVNGSRGEVQSQLDMRTRVAFDLWYIENWSFWLDCQIIFQTIVNLLKGDEKAY
jgi:putative colanic acid biosynthesis UDP-glucose lipid carrier transferase